jgi:hypothetical protein
VCRTAFLVSVQEHFIAYCRCREAVKLFRFLLDVTVINPERKEDHFGDLGIDGNVQVNISSRVVVRGCGMDSSGSDYDTVTCSYMHGNRREF